MEQLKLEIPNQTHELEYARVMDKWELIENDIQPELMRRYSNKIQSNIPFEQWLKYCEDDRTTGSMLSTGVPCTLFFLVKNNTEIVGAIIMNHAATPHGHLHAGIVPWHRGEGYGAKMLKLALEKCLENGMKKVQIVPRTDNIGAIQTILRNGGIATEEFIDDGVEKTRYEIDIKQYNNCIAK